VQLWSYEQLKVLGPAKPPPSHVVDTRWARRCHRCQSTIVLPKGKDWGLEAYRRPGVGVDASLGFGVSSLGALRMLRRG
jgi:hypothetical protein